MDKPGTFRNELINRLRVAFRESYPDTSAEEIEGKLPENPNFGDIPRLYAYEASQADMLKDGWVKEAGVLEDD